MSKFKKFEMTPHFQAAMAVYEGEEPATPPMTDLEALAARVEGAKDVAAIAAGLTKAQREALIKCDTQWRTAHEIGAAGSSLRALCWFWPKGTDPIRPPISLLARDYQDSPLRYIYRLTELGHDIRAHLIAGAPHGR